MSEINNHSLWRRFLELPNHSATKAILVTALVAIVAALVVSTTSVLLMPKQKANIAALRQQQMQQMMSALPGLEDVLSGSDVDTLDTRLVDLANGVFTNEPAIDNYDYLAASTEPDLSIELNASQDIAGIKRRALYAPVYLLQKQGKLQLVVLPVYGTGYQSTIRAWLTLAGDLDTVVAFTINEQAETPGLGKRIEDPDWQALWKQKHVRNNAGEIAISVVKGKGEGVNEVDGITGATRTGQGITKMISFWLGELGFGPFLRNLASGDAQAAIKLGDSLTTASNG